MTRKDYRKWRDYLRLKVLLKAQPLLDAQWYLSQYPDVKKSRLSPLRHYCFFGVEEGRNPGPYFDTRWYLRQYPDVAVGGRNPLLHFLRRGIEEGRNPNPYFDARWYREAYPDVARSGMSPFLHYLNHGSEEGKNPGPYFDTRWYLHEYPDVAGSGVNPLLHYLRHGVEEGKSPNPYFDARWYLEEYPDIARSGVNPSLHYLNHGVEEKRNPNPVFDTGWYLEEYQDVAASGMNPLLHYMRHGAEEGRKPNPDFDPGRYLAEYPAVAASGMEALRHYLKQGVGENKKLASVARIPAFGQPRDGTPAADLVLLNAPARTADLLGFDVVLVTYNSARWVDSCFTSLSPHRKHLAITVVDNGSTDDTVARLKAHAQRFSSMKILTNGSNLGFGAANNRGVRASGGDYLLFLNIDTELSDPTTFEKLSAIIRASKSDVAAWEMRQLPYEHPKCYDPVSLETSWVSGAAVVVRREAFEAARGFDEKMFMYCEDVDLSWRLRAGGYRLLYCPSVTVTHHSYSNPDEIKPVAQLYGARHNYFLRNRYGTVQDVAVGKRQFERLARDAEKNAASAWRGKPADVEKECEYFRQTRCEANQFFKPYFDRYDYELMREGAFHFSKGPRESEKVSVIVRTIGRLHYLERALYSICNQTHKNLEIVVVEDGSSRARELVSTIRDFNVVYRSIEKAGRCQAGNMGLGLATGAYCNFLDEDDLLYCDHVETLVNAISDKPEIGAVWSSAFCVATEETADGRNHRERHYRLAHRMEPDRESILVNNPFPIQSVLFRRECYEKLGGFDPGLEYLEDWDLWIRYFSHYKFMRVRKTTSLYRVPFEDAVSAERKANLDRYLDRVRLKHR